MPLDDWQNVFPPLQIASSVKLGHFAFAWFLHKGIFLFSHDGSLLLYPLIVGQIHEQLIKSSLQFKLLFLGQTVPARHILSCEKVIDCMFTSQNAAPDLNTLRLAFVHPGPAKLPVKPNA